MSEENRLKKLNDKYDKIYNEKYAGQNLHDKPSSETLKELEKLKISRVEDKKDIQFMKEEISEIKDLVKGLDKKLDNVITCKADKEEVKTLDNKVEELNKFMWKVMGISIVGSGILIFLAVKLFEHLTL